VGNHHGQEAGQKIWLRLQQRQVDLWLRIATEPGVTEDSRRNGVETENNKDKSNSCDVYATCDDVRCFL